MNNAKELTRRLPIALTLLAACTPMQIGVVPYPDELLTARKVEIVWPLDDGHYIAVSGDYRCLLEINPLEIRENELLLCRWHKYSTPK